jgi:alkylhydroperoxidase family enzyme
MLETSEEKILAVLAHPESGAFDERERLALEYADCMTLSDRDVSDELFARLKDVFDEDALIELTAAIAWENASSKFNRALRVESQGLWKPQKDRHAAHAD